MNAQAQDMLKDFLYEISFNFKIASPGPHVRVCSSEFRTSYFRAVQHQLGILPSTIADHLRAVYAKLEEENRYVFTLNVKGFDRFRSEDWSEFLSWSKLCLELAGELQQLKHELESLTKTGSEIPEEKIAERRILLKKVFESLALLKAGQGLGDEYCRQFNESGYDNHYKYFKEDEVISRLSESLSDVQFAEITKTNPEATRPYWNFRGKYYTYDPARKELRTESRWQELRSTMEEVFVKHKRAAWAVLKAYLEIREDHSAWSSCDYNRLEYRARELGGKDWKRALIALEIAAVVEKRGSGRRPGERSIALEMIPLVDQMVREWGEKLMIPEIQIPIKPSAFGRLSLFVSYSSADSAFVEKLAKDLISREVKLWLDKWEIKVGDSITEKISEAIKQNDYLAIVLSKNSVQSHWVRKELNAALMKELHNKSVVVLPILLEDCEIPVLISDKKYADFRSSYDEGLIELLRRVSPTRKEG